MELNSSVSMILPEIENDYDEEDTAHEQTNQNEIVELIMAAFEGQDEPSDDDDDDSLNSSDSSQQSTDDTQILNINNNNNNTTEQYVQQETEFSHKQIHFFSPKISKSPTIVPLNELHSFQLSKTDEHLSFDYPSDSPTAFHFVPESSVQTQYLYSTSINQFHETQNQLNKLRILCHVKDRKASQLQNLCEEFQEKYENDTRMLEHQLELSEKLKQDFEQKYHQINTNYEQMIEKNNQLHQTVENLQLKIQDFEILNNQLTDSKSLNESLENKIKELTHSNDDFEIVLTMIKQELISSNEKLENTLLNLHDKTNQFDDLQQQFTHLNKTHIDLLTNFTEDKNQLQTECQQLQSEIRQLREDLNECEIEIRTKTDQLLNRDSLEVSTIDQSIINENLLLKEQLNELNQRIQDCQYQTKRSDSISSSSSSNSSSETVITTSVHMEQIRRLTNQIEKFKKDQFDQTEKFDYEKQELNTIIEQLREDVKDLDQTKQLYIDICQEKNSIEQKSNEYQQDIAKLKIKYQKQINELNNELDQLRTNEDTKNRLIYTENEFEQLKHDYFILNTKYSDLLKSYSSIENQNETIIQSLEQIQQEKNLLIENHEKQIQSSQARLNHFDNLLTQYEDYRNKLENNLTKLLEQRDTYKQELKQTKENNEFQTRNLEKRLEEANHALGLADAHLKDEIDKIKINLEQEYQRRYEREIDRLHHENIELTQHQTKLNDAHEKQMQILKKDLDYGYQNIIQEFECEQTRLQTRYDQLKKQLNEAEQTIEQLKLSLNQLKFNQHTEIYMNKNEIQNRLENLVELLEQSNEALNQERINYKKQLEQYEQTIDSLQKKINDLTIRPMSNGSSTLPSSSTTIEKLQELFTNEMIALLRLTCKMIFDVHHRASIAQYMDNLDIEMRKQIQNELIRSRNSMIKEIRREIFDKMTRALKSQNVSDKSIDMQIFELDHLLSQMVQDCLNSLPLTVSKSLSSSTLSLQIIPQSRQIHTVSSRSSSSSPRKSIEFLYMTPAANKRQAPIAPHCRSMLDDSRRPKSASHVLFINQKPSSASFLSPKLTKYSNETTPLKFHRSENNLMIANDQHSDDNDDTLVEHENDSSKIHYAITKIIQHKKNDTDEELTWPQQPSTSNGIRKFVRNSSKLFISSAHQQKKSSK